MLSVNAYIAGTASGLKETMMIFIGAVLSTLLDSFIMHGRN